MFSINFNQTAEIDTRTFHNVHFVENDCSWTSGEGGMVCGEPALPSHQFFSLLMKVFPLSLPEMGH